MDILMRAIELERFFSEFENKEMLMATVCTALDMWCAENGENPVLMLNKMTEVADEVNRIYPLSRED